MSRQRTVQQAAVEDALRGRDGFCSAQEVYAGMRAAGYRIGLATVYRHLQAFVTRGLADAIRADDGEMAYRLCGDNATGRHHHHLICRECGHAEEVEAPTVERWAIQTARQFGYSDIDHTVEIFGRCQACTAS